ncbi:GNAT family N-acetyltransferase [Carboxylicivirga sediminis]|uniref:GNAT family N-acetyltransferase n=1 Tax=Carboxylicivirga sediminis TaxID=2006564 RepID=A0A941IVD1_9BACT|nr:GNAT family N-acetyltransferase [Carboxylicivirga sediminis]MBR8533998.1 GNAT family N-acetyltransferase [Carboxylicivirga sediminis]
MIKYPISLYNPAERAELTAFLNQNWEYDAITEELLQEKLEGDPDWMPQATFVCKDGQRIIGFMQGVMRHIRGVNYAYIKLMAVDSQYRRQGVATALYQRLEEVFVAHQANVVRIYDVPLNYFMPGIDPRYTPALCWAMRRGFERFGDTSNLVVDLNQDWDMSTREDALRTDGIEVRRAKPEDKQAVLDFIKDEWLLWTNEVEMAFSDEVPSIHIALLNGEVKAFSAHNANNKGTGWFGPMGTHPDLRGKGMGAILLKRCLQDMKEMGLSRSIIPWVGPIDFYAWHANALVDRVFWRFEKKLN